MQVTFRNPRFQVGLFKYGGPGEIRTHDLQLRRLTRYPLRYGSKFKPILTTF
jgi:hypothetical protein